MCFSATASFVVGGSLAVVGVVTLRRAANRAELPFASIPLLFGIQQLVEGLLWFSIQNEMPLLKTYTTYLFTMFSHLIWPIFVPYAVAMMEPRTVMPWRSSAMWGFRITGMVVAVLLLQLVATQPLTAVVDRHIIYVTPFFYDWPMMVAYVVATCIVCFFSTHRMIQLFGLMVLAFFFVSWWFYTEALFSVWCFFAAILSGIIYMHFMRGHPATGEAAL
ncbi:DUF6629 family protein [Pseudomonadota bacterium]